MTEPPQYPPPGGEGDRPAEPVHPPAYPQAPGRPPPPYEQQQPWAAPTSPYAAPQKTGTNGFAIASLVFGIFGGCLFGFVFGFVALSQIKKTGQGGRRMAIAGIVLSAAWTTLLVLGLILSSTDHTERDSTGTITKGGDVSTTELKVGDCLRRLPDADTDIRDVPAIACSEPHEGEVYAVVDLTGSDFPGEDALTEKAQHRCLQELRRIAPEVIKDPTYDVFWFQPTDFTWSRGDRELSCLAATEVAHSGSVLD